MDKGIKENKGKLFYEIDFRFIEAMAQRMATNKGDKYPLYNWKKDIDIQELKQATFRHMIEVMEGNYEDDGRELGHIEAISCNMMMIYNNLSKKVASKEN